jgi:hypothetical protein
MLTFNAEAIPTMMHTGMDVDKDEEEETQDGTEKLLTKEDVDRMRQELDEYMHKWKEEPGNMEYGQELWRKYPLIVIHKSPSHLQNPHEGHPVTKINK